MNPQVRQPVAIITGGGSGIGAATAALLAQQGYRVWILDLAEDRVNKVASLIRESGGDAHPVIADVTDRSSLEAAFQTIFNTDEAIDALITSAGIVAVSPFAEATVEMWDKTYRVNVLGAYLSIQVALPALRRAAPPSRIVVVASAAGQRANVLTAPYNASKAAAINLSRSAALALGPHILVNTICPGVIDTPMWRGLRETRSQLGSAVMSVEDRGAALPAGRVGQPEDVANVIAFVISPQNTFMTGAVIDVDGGLLLQGG